MQLQIPLRSPLTLAINSAFAPGSGGALSTPSFYLNLSNAANATISRSAGRGTITSSVGGNISAQILASRVTGVAPLYVNFDMTGTTKTGDTNPSHNLFYATSFGDTGAGTWANGVQSSGLTDKNWGFGPVTGHVYETPGTYVVEMSVTDGSETETKYGTITVQDPDVVYAGALTICISHSNNFTGAPSGAQQVNTAGNTDMYAAFNTYKASNKRILFCKADSWTASAPMTYTNFAGLYLGGYGTGVAASFGSGTMVSVTPSALGNSLFRATTGNTDLRICNFKITANATTSAVSLNDSIAGALLYKVEIRGCSSGFDAYPGGGGTNNVFDEHCLYECLVDDLDAASAGGQIGAFVGITRGGVMGCYFDNDNRAEQVLRIPYISRGHINNNYLARPNKTKNVLKIHSFVYSEVALYSEKFVVSANVMDLRGGYAYNGTTVTEVGDPSIIIANGGVSGDERCRNAIVENNYTYGCRGEPKTMAFAIIGSPNITVRNNIADFLLGSTGAPYTAIYGYPGAWFCQVTEGPEATVGVKIYNNSLYCNLDDGECPIVRASGATTQVEARNNIGYQPHIGFWADIPIYATNGATITASNNTVNQNTNPNFTATPPVALTDWKPAVGSYAIDAGTTVPVLRDFNMATRVGGTYDMGAVLP